MVQQVKQYIESLPLRVTTDEVRLSQLSQQCEPSHVTCASGTHYCHSLSTCQSHVCPLGFTQYDAVVTRDVKLGLF